MRLVSKQKIHGRSSRYYALVTQQPLRGRAREISNVVTDLYFAATPLAFTLFHELIRTVLALTGFSNKNFIT